MVKLLKIPLKIIQNTEVHFTHTHAHCNFDWVLETFLKEEVFQNKTSCRGVEQLKQEGILVLSKFLLSCR